MPYRAFLILLCCLLADQAMANCEPFPWKFGMSPDEVMAVTECGPYASFDNGDLETYKGVFAGEEHNFQFFFQDQQLRRIGIYLYEGRDLEVATKAWVALHRTMTRMFGAIETPGITPPATSGRDNTAFATSVAAMLRTHDKIQMAPETQPTDAFVFSSLIRRELDGEAHCYVILYLDKRS